MTTTMTEQISQPTESMSAMQLKEALLGMSRPANESDREFVGQNTRVVDASENVPPIPEIISPDLGGRQALYAQEVYLPDVVIHGSTDDGSELWNRVPVAGVTVAANEDGGSPKLFLTDAASQRVIDLEGSQGEMLVRKVVGCVRAQAAMQSVMFGSNSGEVAHALMDAHNAMSRVLETFLNTDPVYSVAVSQLEAGEPIQSVATKAIPDNFQI